MKFVIKEVKNLKHDKNDSIFMDVLFEHIGEFIPFSATPTDTEAHAKELYQGALRGAYGPIAPLDKSQLLRETKMIEQSRVMNEVNSISVELSALRDADTLGVITDSESRRYKELQMYNITANRFLNGGQSKKPILPIK